MLSPLLFAGKLFFFRDFGLFYYPVKRLFLDRLLEGSFPLWVPEMNCGTPLHGELVHALLYPPNLLLLLGAATGWGLYFALHLFVAGIGARRLALRLGARPDAAFAAGIAFAGSGYLVSQLNHVPYASTAAWAPWIVLLVLEQKDGKRSTQLYLTVCLALAALAGEPLTIVLTLFFVAVLVVAGFAGPRWPAAVRVGIAGSVAILLASPGLLPAYQQLGESIRSEGVDPISAGFGSLHPFRLTTVLAPESLGRIQFALTLPIPFFGWEIELFPPVLIGIHLGTLTLLSLMLAPVRQVRAARWLLAVVLVAALASLGTHVGFAHWLSQVVPGLGLFRYPDKYWFLVTLAAAPLLGLALPGIRPAPAIRAASICAVLAFLVCLGTGQLTGAITGAAAFTVAAVLFRLPTARRVKALTALLALELLFFGIRLNPSVDPAGLSPLHPQGLGSELRKEEPGRIFDQVFFSDMVETKEVMPSQMRHMQAMAGIPDGFHYTIGYDPVEPLARIDRFFRIAGDVTPAQRNRIWHRLMRLSATTHTVTTQQVPSDQEVELLTHLTRPNGVRVLRYRRPAERARLYGNTVFVPDWSAGRRKVQDLTFDPFRVLVLEGSGAPQKAGAPRGTVRIREEDSHRITLEVESDRAAWLLLSDAFAEGWKATVDGHPSRIHVGMVAFRAVQVQRGKSVVEFVYRPSWLYIAPYSFGAGFALLLLMAWQGWRRRE